MAPQPLAVVWFCLITVLWVGYLFLEGFDFGVGILTPLLARDELDRRILVNSIGPVWDGNEVWLLVAGGATFAAFPLWYATLFSSLYLALFLILLALIARGVSFEFRNKRESGPWHLLWDQAFFWGSALPALLWGVAFADLLHGIPLNSQHQFVGTFWSLVGPYALLGGLATLSLCSLHGAAFLTLKTTGEVQRRARRAARLLAPAATLALAGFVAWTLLHRGQGGLPLALGLGAVLLVALAGPLLGRRGTLPAFFATGGGIALTVLTIMASLYPRVMVSSPDPEASLTVANSASQPYTLEVMTIIAAIFVPLVLLYQGWSYWTFRQRITR